MNSCWVKDTFCSAIKKIKGTFLEKKIVFYRSLTLIYSKLLTMNLIITVITVSSSFFSFKFPSHLDACVVFHPLFVSV